MAHADHIKFIIEEDPSLSRNKGQVTKPRGEPSSKQMSVVNVLAKIVGEEKFPMDKIIEEEDVEIMLTLSQEERLVLLAKGEKHFSTDAWVAVGANMQHEKTANSCVVPVYTDADGVEYWLFYCTENLNVVLSKRASKKLSGYWLDSKNGKTYQLLHEERSFIYGKNIIMSNICPLYYTTSIPLVDNSFFLVPDVFHQTILAFLQNQAYMLY